MYNESDNLNMMLLTAIVYVTYLYFLTTVSRLKQPKIFVNFFGLVGCFKHSSPNLSVLYLFATSLMIWSNITRLQADTKEPLSSKSNVILGLITASPVPVESNKCSYFLLADMRSFQK